MWGVGPKTAIKFKSFGVERIGQIRKLPRDTLDRAFGLNSEHFWRLARGLDTRAVVPDRVAKSVSHETTFSVDIHSVDALKAWLLELTEQVARRLRRHDIVGHTVHVKIRFGNFQTITRSKTISTPTQTTKVLWETASQILAAAPLEGRGIRLLGMGVSNLSTDGKKQQGLFDQEEKVKATRMDEAADSIRDRFGSAAVKRASSLEHQIRFRAEPRPGDE